MSERIDVPGHDIVGVRAENPGPFALEGTNTWIVGRDPAWLIDPGPDLEEHVGRLAAELRVRGGLGGIALTHDHADHAGAIPDLRARFPDAPLGAARHPAARRLGDGDAFGPLRTLALPGHAPDHLVFLADEVAFSGDAVLGAGSVFVAPDPGALAAYLAGLARLRAVGPALLCPGHGPLVADPDAKLAEYLAHRGEREARLVRALADGARSPQEMLDVVWSDVDPGLRAAAEWTLAAHLDKLADEGRLPAGVQRPDLPDAPGATPR